MACAGKDIRVVFARCGLRCTRQREVLYRALAESRSHPTAEELFEIVGERISGVSLATIYNALHVFSEHGLCRRIPVAWGNRGCRFDANVFDHVHVSLADGSTRDAPEDLSERIIQSIPCELVAELAEVMGVELSTMSVHFEGRTSGEFSDGAFH